MTFSDLHYGWKIAAGVTLAAATIYVADNSRRRVNQVDVIELALAVHERCLATQNSTNPTYSVDPPSIVRDWVTNNGILRVTNTIGFRSDWAMLTNLDAKIKALVPCYVDSSSITYGATNISMLTVTGLWAELGIGDGINKFTATPAIGTNPATFGAWSRRAYIEALEERYKVLWALQIPAPNLIVSTSVKNYQKSGYGECISNGCWATQPSEETEDAFDEAKLTAEADFASASIVTNPGGFDMPRADAIWEATYGIGEAPCSYTQIVAYAAIQRSYQHIEYSATLINTQALPCLDKIGAEVVAAKPRQYGHFYGNGDFVEGTNVVLGSEWASAINAFALNIGDTNLSQPMWGVADYPGGFRTVGGGYAANTSRWVCTYRDGINTNFLYATNRYW